MPTLNVTAKHAGKSYPVLLDVDQPGLKFKEDIYQLTGIPTERMKVMVKGGILKDDASWSKIGPKEGQTFTVIGTAGELPKPPEKKIVFIEDLDDEDLAQAMVTPVGLTNLGNTCYMNATVQTLRAIPELQVALNNAPSSSSALPKSLRDLYNSAGKTTEPITPTAFLTVLRQINPQFAEQSRSGKGMTGMLGGGYAQQDAEECYGTILNGLRDVPVPHADGKKFIEQYMMTQVRREMTTPEAPDEAPTVQLENIMKIECNINIQTNYMHQGIDNAMSTTLTKQSPTLGRTAEYKQTSRLTRLPAYLTVHMVRFAWRQDVGPSGGKAKIMRRVKFPSTYDALEIVTPELKEKLIPVSRRLQEIEKGRDERRKVRKRTKNLHQASTTPAATDSTETPANPIELEPEENYKKREVEELVGLVNADVKNDIGSSWSGVYELVAIITHKGAAADAGHYIGFAKKSVFAPRPILGASNGDGDVTMSDATASSTLSELDKVNPNLNALPGNEEDEDWFKFDDQKVSIFPKEKLQSLEGGGEDSSAYVLLYRTKSF